VTTDDDTASSTLEEISRSECLRLVASLAIGRIGVAARSAQHSGWDRCSIQVWPSRMTMDPPSIGIPLIVPNPDAGQEGSLVPSDMFPSPYARWGNKSDGGVMPENRRRVPVGLRQPSGAPARAPLVVVSGEV